MSQPAAPTVFLFDSCAIVAILLGEPGGAMAGALLSADEDCRVTPVMVSVAAYVLLRAGAVYEELMQDMRSIGVTDAVVMADELRHRHVGLSTADALHLATAQQSGWTLVTSDGPLLAAAQRDGTDTHVIANSMGVMWEPAGSFRV